MRIYGSTIWYESPYAISVRPIITLKSGLNISGGNGSMDNPYTFSYIMSNDLVCWCYY